MKSVKASALISVYGAQVLSFTPVHQTSDLLFVSENAYFQSGKAIKGGVPICWPWFGAAPDAETIAQGKKPDHGFVRNDVWSVVATAVLDNGDIMIGFEFEDSERTCKLWPYQFKLSLKIVISDSLTLELTTCNLGSQAFDITEALHAYFQVGNISEVTVLGLEHSEYLDKNADFVAACHLGVMTFGHAIDQIHTDITQHFTIVDPVLARKIAISSSGNKSVVIWNPGAKGAAEMADLENEDYKYFVCVEVANAATNNIEICPGECHLMTANYSIASFADSDL